MGSAFKRTYIKLRCILSGLVQIHNKFMYFSVALNITLLGWHSPQDLYSIPIHKLSSPMYTAGSNTQTKNGKIKEAQLPSQLKKRHYQTPKNIQTNMEHQIICQHQKSLIQSTLSAASRQNLENYNFLYYRININRNGQTVKKMDK